MNDSLHRWTLPGCRTLCVQLGNGRLYFFERGVAVRSVSLETRYLASGRRPFTRTRQCPEWMLLARAGMLARDWLVEGIGPTSDGRRGVNTVIVHDGTAEGAYAAHVQIAATNRARSAVVCRRLR